VGLRSEFSKTGKKKKRDKVVASRPRKNSEIDNLKTTILFDRKEKQ